MPRRASVARDAEPPPDGNPGSALRRAPFSANPRVGARGQQAQQRILEAALRAFGEDGYHECGVIRISKAAGCSRAAFYQYFSSKEDVFRHLAGRVARQLTASAEALEPITPDRSGWASVRAWVERHGDVYDRYEPMFRVAQAAAESDEAIASGSERTRDRSVAVVRSKLAAMPVPGRHLDAVVALLLETMSRTPHVAAVVERALASPAYPRSRVDDALADIVHRTLAGFDPDVNVHAPALPQPPRAQMGPVMRQALVDDTVPAGLSPGGADTRASLLKAGHDVLVSRGYHGTRVDDIAAAAGLSHGAFYRYFDNKDHLIRLLAAQALRTVSRALADIPDVAVTGPSGAAALRRWLRRYDTTNAAEAAMIGVWVDATADDPSLSVESGAALDWARGRMVRFLAPRGFGDLDTEALVMVALLDAFGARRRDASMVDAAVHIIQRGLLGHA